MLGFGIREFFAIALHHASTNVTLFRLLTRFLSQLISLSTASHCLAHFFFRLLYCASCFGSRVPVFMIFITYICYCIAKVDGCYVTGSKCNQHPSTTTTVCFCIHRDDEIKFEIRLHTKTIGTHQASMDRAKTWDALDVDTNYIFENGFLKNGKIALSLHCFQVSECMARTLDAFQLLSIQKQEFSNCFCMQISNNCPLAGRMSDFTKCQMIHYNASVFLREVSIFRMNNFIFFKSVCIQCLEHMGILSRFRQVEMSLC